MEREDDEVHAETDGARAGSTPHIVRWILIGGLILAIALLSATWIIGALGMEEQGSVATTPDRLGEQQEDPAEDTDSIVSDGFDRVDEAEPAEQATPGASDAEPTAVEN